MVEPRIPSVGWSPDRAHLVYERHPETMRNPDYGLVARVYSFGQYCIQLCRADRAATIVRALCTGSARTALRVAEEIAAAENPEAQVERYARLCACEAPGGRIRLDSRPDRDSG